jgi:MoxR-like ATPase
MGEYILSWKEDLDKVIKNNWNSDETFTLEEIYKFEDDFQKLYPDNNHVREKLRQTLQKLRDDNLVEFLSDRGEYKIINTDASSNIDQNHKKKFRDYLVKVISDYKNARLNEEFAGHELGDLMRHQLPEFLEKEFSSYLKIDNYIIKGSIGMGIWAKIPWLAIMNKDITTTTQEGVYVVYLFSQDMERVYLTFNQGVTRSTKEEFINNRDKLGVEMNLDGFKKDNEIDLAEDGKGKKYELSNICYRKYEADELINNQITEETLIEDLIKMMDIYQKYYKHYYLELDAAVIETAEGVSEKMDDKSTKEKLSQIKNYIKAQGYTYPDNLIENFYLSLKTKPFVLLAGISGTGKTKLVELFARAIGCSSDNDRFKLISVKPDWNDSADLLGYSNIRGDFQPGPILETIKKAANDPDNPYLVCLDEMNLARVEYYFSDFLSKMETRHYAGDQIKTDRLLSENDFDQNDSNDSKAKYSNLHIPDNLYLVGTVNMDETTHPFSKKVLDRANTIEFNQIDLTAFLEEDHSAQAQSLNIDNQFLKTNYLNLKDLLPDEHDEVKRITEELERLNQILKKANLQVGYRIRDEINFYIIEALDKELLDENTAFDKEILQKVLPRIQGSSAIIKEILLELFDFFTGANYSSENGQLAAGVWNYYQANKDTFKYPESAEKIAYMLRRFEEDGFTSYWL